jgi:hypothetical protein
MKLRSIDHPISVAGRKFEVKLSGRQVTCAYVLPPPLTPPPPPPPPSPPSEKNM